MLRASAGPWTCTDTRCRRVPPWSRSSNRRAGTTACCHKPPPKPTRPQIPKSHSSSRSTFVRSVWVTGIDHAPISIGRLEISRGPHQGLRFQHLRRESPSRCPRRYPSNRGSAAAGGADHPAADPEQQCSSPHGSPRCPSPEAFERLGPAPEQRVGQMAKGPPTLPLAAILTVILRQFCRQMPS